MKDLNEKQLAALQQIATNAATVVLGTMILGRFFASQSFGLFGLISSALGLMIYSWLILWILRVNQGGGIE